MTSSGITAEIKSKLPVIDVVGETVALKRAGSAYKGLCPFHAEKTPSFIVSPDRETWRCFGCGVTSQRHLTRRGPTSVQV